MTEELRTKDQASIQEAQLARVREWIASAKDRKYRKSDKRRYAKLSYDGQFVIMTPSEAEVWLDDCWDETYVLDEVWMTEKQYEDLPEFEGF